MSLPKTSFRQLPCISTVEPSENWARNEPSSVLDGALERRILVKSEPLGGGTVGLVGAQDAMAAVAERDEAVELA